MASIYVMGIVFNLVALGLFALIMWKMVPGELRRVMLWLFVVELPLQPLNFLYLRRPMHAWLKGVCGEHTRLYEALLTLSPTTEELAKLLPVVVLVIFWRRGRENWRLMFAPVGFGFGIGEGWLIAWAISHDKAAIGMPWYYFSGYLGERLMVCFIHGWMTCVGLKYSLGEGRWIKGTLLSVGLHFVLDAPILFVGPRWLNWPAAVNGILLGLWVLGACCLAVTFMLEGGYAARLGKALFGRAKCAQCGEIYDRSLWGMNLGARRYEKCPKCGKWNLTGEFKEEGTKGT